MTAGICLYMLYELLGNSIFAGIGCMLLGPPISFVTGYFEEKLRTKSMEVKDERIKVMNEVLSGIKVSCSVFVAPHTADVMAPHTADTLAPHTAEVLVLTD